MRLRFGILLSVLFLAGTLKSHASTDQPLWPVLGVSSNLAYDITYIPNYGLTSIPNVSLELYLAQAPHYSVGLDVDWSAWKHYDTHRFMQIHNVSLWGRRYFKPRDNRRRGWYVLAGGNMGNFGIGWQGKGWQGEAVGLSMGAGYKWASRKSRIYLDFGVALGLLYALYDPYVYGYDATGWYYYDYAGDPAEFAERNRRLIWLGPTRVYLSIGIDLFNRKRK